MDEGPGQERMVRKRIRTEEKMTTLYLILSTLALSAFTYFVFYRGWRKGLACGEKRARQQVETQIQKSKELVAKTVKEVEEAMAQVKRVQNQIWDMEITKDKKKKVEKKSEIYDQSTMIQALYNDLLARQHALNARAGLNFPQLANLQDPRLSNLLGQAAQGLFPPWPFNQ